MPTLVRLPTSTSVLQGWTFGRTRMDATVSTNFSAAMTRGSKR